MHNIYSCRQTCHNMCVRCRQRRACAALIHLDQTTDARQCAALIHLDHTTDDRQCSAYPANHSKGREGERGGGMSGWGGEDTCDSICQSLFLSRRLPPSFHCRPPPPPSQPTHPPVLMLRQHGRPWSSRSSTHSSSTRRPGRLVILPRIQPDRGTVTAVAAEEEDEEGASDASG